MKKFFHQNKVFVGVVAELGSVLAASVLLYVVLLIAGEQALPHVRWFGGTFIPGILVVRYYAKAKDYPVATKATVVSFAILFVAFMAYLVRNRII